MAAMALSREQTIANILGTAYNTGKRAVSTGATYLGDRTGVRVEQVFSEENGSYFLNTLFYMCLYSFLFFLVLVLVHFTITPVFKFTPGGSGIIGVPSATGGDLVYWNNKNQPAAPIFGDSLYKSLKTPTFVNNFSFSVDLYIRRINDTNSGNRVILYKGKEVSSELDSPPSDTTLDTYMASHCSMYTYLTGDTNDLVVTFFSGTVATQYASPPIKNIPLYSPFRLTVVVEKKSFTVYINAKQTFQRIFPVDLSVNLTGITNQRSPFPQLFYPPPLWADLPSKSVFVQNLHLWDRAISYPEVLNAQPALALASDFDLPAEPQGESCS